MASTYTTSLKIQEIGNGEQSGSWGTTTNTNWTLIEQAVAGVQTITMSNANYTLTNLNGVSDEARNMVLVVQGTNSGIYQIVAPLNQPKMYVISNQTSGGYAITIGASTGSVVTIPNGVTAQVYTDGTNFYSAQTGSAGNFNVNGTLTASGIADVGNLSVSGNGAVTGNLSVTGTTTLSGTATAPTPSSSDNSTNIATTAFVQTKVGTLGTMATQNANAVAITGGSIQNVYPLTCVTPNVGSSGAIQVRANASGGYSIVQFTDNAGATQYGYISASSSNVLNLTGTGGVTANGNTVLTTANFASSGIKLGLGITGENWYADGYTSGVTYTNSNSYPIMHSVTGTNSGGNGNKQINGYVNGQQVANAGFFSGTGNNNVWISFIVPPGQTFYVDFGGSSVGIGISNWWTLR